jgi:NADPH-dependent glutamate synthase beta subunit-like oxidoreductase/NAD(P)H-flavin reductase
VTTETTLTPDIAGFELADLHAPEGLARLFETFRSRLGEDDDALAGRYEAWLAGAELNAKDTSSLLIDVARHVSQFLIELFGIDAEAAGHRQRVTGHRSLFEFRKRFVKTRAARSKPDAADDAQALEPALRDLLGGTLDEQTLADAVLARLDAEPADADDALLSLAERYVAVRLRDGQVADWASLKLQGRVDFGCLVETETVSDPAPGTLRGPPETLRRRDGFALTDDRGTLSRRLGEIDNCLFCHERGVDSCNVGMKDKQGELKSNPLGIPLPGCPLDERISESHVLADEGDPLAALAMIMLDNPMCPGTGHRICNDCMKACIFQRQDPVDIPRAETGTLTDVLDMSWGAELYGLLARWNPLNRKRPYALPYNGLNVLVVGLGPAGYTLAHYLLNEGFAVVAVDGLKIEPLSEQLVGARGATPPALRDFASITSPLDERVPSGFGGVSEYGITVRWDKNFLELIHMTLARRERFTAYGGVRFGGTLDLDDCWTLGFDHIAMATGAGRPTIIDMRNNLTRGVRKASDFLMALQLTGAFRRDGLSNLQLELPAIVVGGGLTAIDTATEVMAYYPVQVERLLARHEILVETSSESEVLARLSEPEREIHTRFLEHARALRGERSRAADEGRQPDFVPLLRDWGGVTICYRKGLDESPAYRLNHEEVMKALEEGIGFLEGVTPLHAVDDRHDALKSVVLDRLHKDDSGRWRSTGETLTLPARAMFIAAGTHPNTIYEKEHPGTFDLDERGRYFQSRDASGRPAPDGFFTSRNDGGRRVSFYGDNHAQYAGNVVKAMASAKHGYPHVVDLFREHLDALDPARQAERDLSHAEFLDRLDGLLRPRVVRVERLTPTIVDVIVHAPLAARHFQPGQFYRLQNYEYLAEGRKGSQMVMEGIALTGAWVDREAGLLSMIVLEMGGSSSLCAQLREGEEVVVMGPTGAPTEIPTDETIGLIGGGLGNAVLFSIAGAMKAAGNRVLYFAGYRDSRDVFKREQIEAATDAVIWCCDAGPDIAATRPQDAFFRGNIVAAMEACGRGEFPEAPIRLSEIQRMIVIGSDGMMRAVKQARHASLAQYLGPHIAIGSINSPMQCMMKEVCAQCLQRHVDPITGEQVEPVFSCFNQDQLLDAVDFGNLHERLGVNSVLEKATARWIAHMAIEDRTCGANEPADGQTPAGSYDSPSPKGPVGPSGVTQKN